MMDVLDVEAWRELTFIFCTSNYDGYSPLNNHDLVRQKYYMSWDTDPIFLMLM